jgi:hypothetical protein
MNGIAARLPYMARLLKAPLCCRVGGASDLGNAERHPATLVPITVEVLEKLQVCNRVEQLARRGKVL